MVFTELSAAKITKLKLAADKEKLPAYEPLRIPLLTPETFTD